jgi:hypothetical protein
MRTRATGIVANRLVIRVCGMCRLIRAWDELTVAFQAAKSV